MNPKDFILKKKNDMLTNINPKLPMRNKTETKDFYVNKLGFKNVEA
jgi:hypothetical protein